VKILRILEIDPPLAFHPPTDIEQTTIDPDCWPSCDSGDDCRIFPVAGIAARP
jgi:hypothetical protein